MGNVASRFKAADPNSPVIPDYLRKIFDEYRAMDADKSLTTRKWIDGAAQMLGRLQGELEKLPPPVEPEQEFGQNVIDHYIDKNGVRVPFVDSTGQPYKLQRGPSRNGELGKWEIVPDPDQKIREVKAQKVAEQEAASKLADDKLARERSRGVTLEDAKVLSEALKNAGVLMPEPPDLTGDTDKDNEEKAAHTRKMVVYEEQVREMRRIFGLKDVQELRIPKVEAKRLLKLSAAEQPRALNVYLEALTLAERTAVMARGRARYDAVLRIGLSEDEATRQATEAMVSAINSIAPEAE